jgi:hypothetical protein
MQAKIGKITEHWRGVNSSAPVGIDGDYYINSNDNGYYVYYSGGWNLVGTAILSTGILLENGDYMLLETEDIILQES